MMNIKDIGNKIVNRDFGDLFNFKRGEKTIHPAEIANILHDLPAANALKGFNTLPANTQIKVFPYLDIPWQQQQWLTSCDTDHSRHGAERIND